MYNWLGTFRQGSWQSYRRYILEERRDVGERIAVIQAELTRIGEVTVVYASAFDDEGNQFVAETREGFYVSPGSSLGKLCQAYVAMGGNPFDISLFLTPDATAILDATDPEQAGTDSQPNKGVVYPKSGAYTPGERYTGGELSIKKYLPARIGGRKHVEDAKVATRIDASRKWLRQGLKHKKGNLEHRIIKLCDLREQLLEELDRITGAIAGMSAELPHLDEERFDKELSVAFIVSTIDSIFYETDETNTPDFATENKATLGSYPFLLSDDEEEANTAL
jgi:hypothetical protein